MLTLALLTAALLGQQPFVGMPPESVTTKDVTYWVGPGGSDGFDCLQATRPCKTIQGAYDKVPKNTYHHATVQLLDSSDGGVVNYVGAIVQGFRNGSSMIPDAGMPLLELRGRMGPFTPATGLSSGTLTAFVAQSGATNALLTDSLGGWVDGGLTGQYVAAISGTGSTGSEAVPPVWAVTANTATTISVASTGITLAAGTGYQLQRATTRINAPPVVPAASTTTTSRAALLISGLTFVNNSGAFFSVNRVGFDLGTAMVRGITLGSTRTQLMLVQMSGGAGTAVGVTFNNIDTLPSVQIDRFASVYPVGVGSHILLGAGGSNPAGGGVSFTSSYMRGGVIGLSLGVGTNTVIQGVVVDGVTTGVSAGFVFAAQVLQTRIFGCTTGWSSPISSTGFPLSTGGLSSVDLSNNTTAINLEGGSASVALTGTTGTGNTTALKLSFGAKARVNSATTLTGTTEVSLDGVASDYATMRAATPKLVTNTYGTIFFE